MAKKLFVAAGCLVLFSAGWCLGQEQAAKHQSNGASWKALRSATREMYALGFIHGYNAGTFQADTLLKGSVPNKISAMTPDDKKGYEWDLALANKVYPVFLQDVSASSLESRVSTFYGDYRNMSVCLVDATVLSAAALGGNPATDEELSRIRKHGAESGCK